MAKQPTTKKRAPKTEAEKTAGKCVVIVSEKTGERKACTEDTLTQFREFHPDAGDYKVESRHETLEDAVKTLEEKHV